MKPGKLSSYSDLELALMILLGVYGNGAARKAALGSRYAAAQGIVEQILRMDIIPDGSGSIDAAKVKKAVQSVFDDTINEITEGVINKL